MSKAKNTTSKIKNKGEAIAVIGMGCQYPGANNLKQLWENILARRRQFRQMPDVRLPVSEYYDRDPKTPDKTYGDRAAVIDGFQFDWASKRIPKTAFDSTDIVHWLALEVALQALENAGYNRKNVVTERSGVVLGNTLTGEHTRAQSMRLRWPFVRRALLAAAEAKGLPLETASELQKTMEQFYKSVFSPITEDTLAGGLSNTIAGRICNFFNFDGGGYTVDGACSSSLIAVATACNHLVNGDLDLALAGGVDISLDTFELIGFAKTGALTAADMTVYDRKASGFIPGEGCGFAVLKRLEDARRDRDYIYAVIHGWGISSDGKGGITAPSKVGQAKALRRAYEKAGYSPHTLDFIEGHGTGTPKGDRTELEGISLAMSYDGELAPSSCAITSFKSIVGHTKAAAGIGGFIKAVMAVNQRVIPPTAGCQDPNPAFDSAARCLYPVLHGEIRNPDETLKAGVFGAGFGGINCHVAISSGDNPAAVLKPSLPEAALLVSNQNTELFALSAPSLETLLERTRSLKQQASGISLAEMVDLAAQLSKELAVSDKVRSGLIADTPKTLMERLQQLEQMLDDKPPARGEVVVSPQQDIWIGNAVNRNRVAFLFPGQGSQKLNMARTLVKRYSWAREFLARADRWLSESGFEPISQYIYRPLDRAADSQQVKEWFKELTSAVITPPAICFTSLLWKRYLERLGIEPVAVGGHSLGELTAFQVAGAYDEKTLLCFAALRGRAMSASEENAGTMASLGCDRETASRLIDKIPGYVTVANINSSMQTVISGEKDSIASALKRAAAEEIQTRQLPVANAFHSQMVARAAEHLRQQVVIPEQLPQTSTLLLSGVPQQQVFPGMNLREHFANQIVARVDFVSLVEAIAPQCDLIVEVGPGKILSNLVKANTSQTLCLPVESKPGCDRDLNAVVASFFVRGGEIDWSALYEERLVRPFVPASERIFIDNPCQRSFPVALSANASKDLAQSHLASTYLTEPDWETLLSDYFNQRGSFLAELIRADLENW